MAHPFIGTFHTTLSSTSEPSLAHRVHPVDAQKHISTEPHIYQVFSCTDSPTIKLNYKLGAGRD